MLLLLTFGITLALNVSTASSDPVAMALTVASALGLVAVVVMFLRGRNRGGERRGQQS
ncbi:MAG: hypothetical protein Q4F65_03620 [Propionibacteriaceae bacterium]|nr:hypothetical protein [Propionibacteriaceae bacterium]